MFEHCLLSDVCLHHTDKERVLAWCERIWCGAGDCCRQLSVGVTRSNRLIAIRGTPRILRMRFYHNRSRDFLMAGRPYIIQNTLSNRLSAKGFHVTLKLLQANFGKTLSMQVCKVFFNFNEIFQRKITFVYVKVFYYP